MSALHPVTLVTIVAEAVLEARIVRDLQACGARGWTVSLSHGHGAQDRRNGDIAGGNVRIESLMSAGAAERVMALLESDYFADYSVVAWVTEARVARPERYA